MNKNRNSSIELLRILSIFGIIMMHCFGKYYLICAGYNLVFGIIINVLFNTGVTCFMLISGFYGLKFNFHKLIRILLLVLFYSYIDLLIHYIFSNSSFTFSRVLQSIFPLLTGKYWYISCYIIIYILSDYINEYIYQLSYVRFTCLLIILLIIYYVAPSILNFQLMNDSGKGIVNMFIVYLTGIYINKYYNYFNRTSALIIIYFINAIIMFCYTFFVSSICGGVGIKYPMLLRDNSIFIYINSICLFIYFSKHELYNSIVNLLASCVFGIYLNEGIVRYIINNINFEFSIDCGVIIKTILLCILVFVISIIVEFFRKCLVKASRQLKLNIDLDNIISFLNNKQHRFIDFLNKIRYKKDLG